MYPWRVSVYPRLGVGSMRRAVNMNVLYLSMDLCVIVLIGVLIIRAACVRKERLHPLANP